MYATVPATSSKSCPASKNTGANQTPELAGCGNKHAIHQRHPVAVLRWDSGDGTRGEKRPRKIRQPEAVFIDSNVGGDTRSKRERQACSGAVAAHAGDGNRVLLPPGGRRLGMPATDVDGFDRSCFWNRHIHLRRIFRAV